MKRSTLVVSLLAAAALFGLIGYVIWFGDAPPAQAYLVGDRVVIHERNKPTSTHGIRIDRLVSVDLATGRVQARRGAKGFGELVGGRDGKVFWLDGNRLSILDARTLDEVLSADQLHAKVLELAGATDTCVEDHRALRFTAKDGRYLLLDLATLKVQAAATPHCREAPEPRSPALGDRPIAFVAIAGSSTQHLVVGAGPKALTSSESFRGAKILADADGNLVRLDDAFAIVQPDDARTSKLAVVSAGGSRLEVRWSAPLPLGKTVAIAQVPDGLLLRDENRTAFWEPATGKLRWARPAD